MARRTRVTLLAGGTGGAKLARGLALLGDAVDLTVIANVADDTEMHGLHVSPDIDAICYHLAGIADTERGWGIAGDTRSAHAMLERLGAPAWFTIGDADLATSIERTRRLRDGQRLTEVVTAMASALRIGARVLPATDDRYRTVVVTDAGPLEFQDYFVRLRQEPEVRELTFDGADTARPTNEMLEAIAGADLVVIGPSNPLVSIAPIVALPGVRSAIEAARGSRVAVSPIVAGAALKGPAARMLASLGHEVSARGVARIYAGLVERFVIDLADADAAPSIEALGLAVDVLPTIMSGDEQARALAAAVVEPATGA
ncbi:MAG: 2-phospho-L-lactate transferase [Chloroflexi bacterium]|nr:2-phospho-L-lactate transferase [Chloroflexota bacterium]